MGFADPARHPVRFCKSSRSTAPFSDPGDVRDRPKCMTTMVRIQESRDWAVVFALYSPRGVNIDFVSSVDGHNEVWPDL